MCGIVGYIGNKRAVPVIIDGLKRLEYRGYDSAGIVAFGANGFNPMVIKQKGRVVDLEKSVDFDFDGSISVGHSRWSTHGEPNHKNSHPHWDCAKKIFVVHNGIIENYKILKEKLVKKGHIFTSETDTEIMPHLIEDILKSKNGKITFEEGVRLALNIIKGSYAFAILNTDDPQKLIVAKNSSPLLIGIGKNEYFVASDASPLLPYTRRVVYLNDGEYGILTRKGYRVADLARRPLNKETCIIEWNLEEASKQGYSHFMLKEIFEEPEAVENSIRGRIIADEGRSKLGGLESVVHDLKRIENIVITACGTAYYAGLVGRYLLEEYAGISTETDCASELRYRKPVFKPNTAFLAISQSGETADTLAALKELRHQDVLTLGINNVVASSIAREVKAGVYNHVGPEIGVASTKAFVSQLTVLVLLAIFLGRERILTKSFGKKICGEMRHISSKMKRFLRLENKHVKNLARRYHKYNHFLYLGRKYNYPIALEGALKLKEISYIHAEGYGAGEMKHGPIALIDENFPSMFIATKNSVYDKIISNMEEIKARKGKIIAIATEGDKTIKNLADDVIYVSPTIEPLEPILTALPLHLFAYYAGIFRGCDVDKPRNLAKSVTVE
jgi:glucosamine--fructose-6-phosphate aminotransferase (isomerizing)